MLRTLSSFVVFSALAFAQDAAAPAEPQAPVLPKAESDEALAMVDKALDKTLAYARGTFTTVEGQDSAMFRNAGLPIGPQETEISGGWDRSMIWAESDGRDYVMANGRMLAKVDGGWRLRRGKLAGGVQAPFTLDPDYMIQAIKQLPKKARTVVHVEPGKLRGKAMALLTIKIDGDDALEFSDCGAVPDVSGGLGGVMMLGGLGGAMEPPRPELETYLVFYVDQESGDLARVAVKTYSTDEMMGQIQIAAGGGFGGEEEELVEEEEEDEGQQGPVKWKRGLPRIKPAKDQSVMNFRADFRKLGMAEAPKLDERAKALLHVR